MKRKSIPQVKKKAWSWFSKFIRIRDCLETSLTIDRGECFTCGMMFPFKKLQAGHFIDGRGASVLFHEDLVHAQCSGCNMFKNGNKDSYTPKMIQRYGLKKVEEFWQLKNKVHHWTIEELQAISDLYEMRYNALYKHPFEEI